MKSFALAFIVLFIAALSLGAKAQDGIPPVSLGIPADKFDFTGTWNYSTSNHNVSGRCPNGKPMSGTMQITHSGAAVGLMISSGATCNPGSMCIFDGAIDSGGQVTVSNTDTVDEEGGEATNAMRLFFLSEELGAGLAASGYVHPDGFECQWSHYIQIWR
ncbi:hypothetical protein [Roseovarius sp. Pro17]|uniref:hypothetical protein n=1 Tax=Roseovarius sp. Pro17 TaxID=3108175 RepID=UPI002D79E7BD|nr:hypothetical protein [Roseovarius sp. Pro17]